MQQHFLVHLHCNDNNASVNIAGFKLIINKTAYWSKTEEPRESLLWSDQTDRCKATHFWLGSRFCVFEVSRKEERSRVVLASMVTGPGDSGDCGWSTIIGTEAMVTGPGGGDERTSSVSASPRSRSRPPSPSLQVSMTSILRRHTPRQRSSLWSRSRAAMR